MALYDRKDHFYRKAKSEGLRSRAAYKLMELDDKYKLLKPGSKVVDLGCFPGGWVQVAAERVGPKGLVVGIDLKDVEPFSAREVNGGGEVRIFKGDLSDRERLAEISALGPYNTVLSDMSPNLSGIKFSDEARAAALLELALQSCKELLKPRGNFVAKTFPHQETEDVIKSYRGMFEKLQRIRLKSTRTTSNEMYVVGFSFRGV